MSQNDKTPSQSSFAPDSDSLDAVHSPAKSLYGLPPTVEAAILDALDAGEQARIKALTAPLHSADMADLLERVRPDMCRQLLMMLGDELDSEVIAYLDEDTRELVLDIMGLTIAALCQSGIR